MTDFTPMEWVIIGIGFLGIVTAFILYVRMIWKECEEKE